jgi:hypothetical protein
MTGTRFYGIGLASVLGIALLLGLSSPPPSAQLPFNGVDLKTPQKISGKSLIIERFAGTLIIKTADDPDNLTLIATGKEDELNKMQVLTDQEGEIKISRNGEISNSTIILTITMPKQALLSLHMNYGKATLSDHSGPVSLFIEGSGTITTGTLGGDLESRISGNGDITITNINSTIRTTPLSPLKLSIQGNGKMIIKSFNYEDIKATINGAGLIILNGTVHNGDFTINGAGRIEIAKILGKLSQSTSGSGTVVVTGK